jgi:peptide/nickel transport system ATP-binding protein
MTTLLQVDDLQVDFHGNEQTITAIRNLQLTIHKGETVCIVGESGSGKTVASKSIMRLIEFEQGYIANGSIYFGDVNLVTLQSEKLRAMRGYEIAMIFQEPMSAFDPVFTIGQQIVETIQAHENVSNKEAKERAIYLLNRVGISDPLYRFKQYPNELSGGMLQRAMIAMALACKPKLLIADEPTTALDVTIQAQILALLEELKVEFDMSILLITHDMGVAAQIADKVVVMYAGEVVEEAPAKALFEQPKHPYSIGLLQSITTLTSDRTKPLYSIKGTIPSLTSLPTGCLFHPRCPYATEQCQIDKPSLVQEGNRKVACFHKDGIGSFEQAEMKSEPLLSPNTLSFEPLLEVRHLSKKYPVQSGGMLSKKVHIQAVDDVSFSIRKGETFGLVGESGSGKSTLGKLILQLERATTGDVQFNGQSIEKLSGKQLRSLRKNIQMIHQDPYGSVNPRWTVGRILEEPLVVHTTQSKEVNRARAIELLQLVGLPRDAYDRYPHEFSGGQRQRIAIARAIALHPNLLVADEAVSALDVSVQAQIINLLKELQRELQLTILFIGHGLQVVRHVSDRVGVMYLGQLVEIGDSEQLFASPKHPYTKALIDAIPSFTKNDENQLLVEGEIPSPIHPPSGCRFHTRCPYATELCKAEQPELKTYTEGQFVACHYPLQ